MSALHNNSFIMGNVLILNLKDLTAIMKISVFHVMVDALLAIQIMFVRNVILFFLTCIKEIALKMSQEALIVIQPLNYA